MNADLVVVHGYQQLPVDKRRDFARAVQKVAEALGSMTIDLSYDSVVANVDRAELTATERSLILNEGPRLAEDLSTLVDPVAQFV